MLPKQTVSLAETEENQLILISSARSRPQTIDRTFSMLHESNQNHHS